MLRIKGNMDITRGLESFYIHIALLGPPYRRLELPIDLLITIGYFGELVILVKYT